MRGGETTMTKFKVDDEKSEFQLQAQNVLQRLHRVDRRKFR